MSEEKIAWICLVECLICQTPRLTSGNTDPEVGNCMREYCLRCSDFRDMVVRDFALKEVALQNWNLGE